MLAAVRHAPGPPPCSTSVLCCAAPRGRRACLARGATIQASVCTVETAICVGGAKHRRPEPHGRGLRTRSSCPRWAGLPPPWGCCCCWPCWQLLRFSKVRGRLLCSSPQAGQVNSGKDCERPAPRLQARRRRSRAPSTQKAAPPARLEVGGRLPRCRARPRADPPRAAAQAAAPSARTGSPWWTACARPLTLPRAASAPTGGTSWCG